MTINIQVLTWKETDFTRRAIIIDLAYFHVETNTKLQDLDKIRSIHLKVWV